MTTTISGDTGIDKVQDGTITQAALAENVAGTGPAFSVYQSVAQSVPQNAYTKIQFDVKERDTANAFSAGIKTSNTDATNRFTAPVAGYFQFNCCCAVSAYFATMQLILFVNGSVYRRIGIQFSSLGVGGSALIPLSAGDYVEFFLFQSAEAQNTVASFQFTWAQGFLARAA